MLRTGTTNASPPSTSCIHTYLVLRSPTTLFRPRPCPNCNHTPPSIIPRWQWQTPSLNRPVALPADNNSPPTMYRNPTQAGPAGPGHSRSSREIYAPFIKHYDDDAGDAEARESSEFQTSGFNTPRQSAETLRSEARESREGLGKDREVVMVDRKDAGSLV